MVGAPAVGLLVVGMEVQRAPVDGEADAAGTELFQEAVAVDLQALEAETDHIPDAWTGSVGE